MELLRNPKKSKQEKRDPITFEKGGFGVVCERKSK